MKLNRIERFILNNKDESNFYKIKKNMNKNC